MIKYIKKRLSIKIFLLTTAILVGIAAVTYGIVAEFMPRTYSEALNRTLEKSAEGFAKSLAEYTLDNGAALLQNFSQSYQSRLILTDSKGGIVYEENWTAAETAYAEENVTEDFAAEIAGAAAESYGKQAMGHFSVVFKDSSEEYTLFVFGSTQQVNQAVQALKKVLPYLTVIILAVSVLIAAFYSWYLAAPVKRLSRISRQMAELDFHLRSGKKREDELGILSESLDILAESLDVALTEVKQANAQLKSDMEKQREDERLRMEFFAAASHELKTPVTILKGQIEGMLEGIGSYRDRDRHLGRAKEIVETMETMVQEILTVSRLESREFAVHPAMVDFAELIRIQLADLNELFEEKQMNMKIVLPAELRWSMDASMMTVVIRNLLVNAARYSPEGAEITVELTAGTGEAVLTVENSGVSLPEEDLQKIFNAFYRVEASRNSRRGGSGLGLYIVREILEKHHAAYSMENMADGVKFTSRLPAENQAELS